MGIQCAAIRQNGTVYSLPRPARHGDVFRLMLSQRVALRGSEQGFLTDAGEFVGREEAFLLAEQVGQILPGHEFPPKVLLTEDLW